MRSINFISKMNGNCDQLEFRMKLNLLNLLNTLVLFSLLATNLYAQNGQAGADESILPNSAIPEGVKFAKSKKFDKAREQFAGALAFWQHYPLAALYLQVLTDLDNGVIKKKEASEMFKAVLEGQKGAYDKAVKRFRKLGKKKQDYFPILLMQADAELNLDNEEAAQVLFDDATTMTTQSVLPLLLRGRFYTTNNEGELAIADFSKALQIEPTSAICLFERGFAYALAKDYDAAINDFTAVAPLHPDWGKSSVVTEVYFNRGVALSEKKKHRAAIRDFDRAIRIKPDYLDSYLNRGIAYRNIKRSTQAMQDFNHCISQNPQFLEAYYQRALIHFARKKYSKAAVDLRKAMELDPGNRKAAFKLAESYYKLGNYRKALTHFNNVIKLDKNYYWAYYWKGFSAQYSKKPKVALVAFQSFLSRAPKRFYKQISHAEVAIQKLKTQVR